MEAAWLESLMWRCIHGKLGSCPLGTSLYMHVRRETLTYKHCISCSGNNRCPVLSLVGTGCSKGSDIYASPYFWCQYYRVKYDIILEIVAKVNFIKIVVTGKHPFLYKFPNFVSLLTILTLHFFFDRKVILQWIISKMKFTMKTNSAFSSSVLKRHYNLMGGRCLMTTVVLNNSIACEQNFCQLVNSYYAKFMTTYILL